MIYGNGKHISHIGNTFSTDGDDFNDVGNTFSGYGMHMNDMGDNMSGSIGGSFVSMNVTGNDIHCSNGLSFNLIGDTLTCSDGSHWFGVSDMEEAKRVAAMHMR